MDESLTILYFAWLRQRTDASREDLPIPDGVATVADLIAYLADRSPGHASAFRDVRGIRCAVNQEFADLASPIRPGDEVAFFPPVTGG